MKVIWDEPKREANLAKHGFDFAEFENAFSFDRFDAFDAKPSHDGRPRFLLVGTWNGTLVVAAIIAPLGAEAVSLISVRPASAKERNAYDRL